MSRAWALTGLQGHAGPLIQAHLGRAVRCLHVGQNLVVLGGQVSPRAGPRCGPTPSASPTSWERAWLRHLPTSLRFPPSPKEALALPTNLPPAPILQLPPCRPTHPWGGELALGDLGAPSITSRSSSLGRAALSMFCSLLSIRLIVGSWKLAFLNRRARVPKYSMCWDFSVSLRSWKEGHHICCGRLREGVRVPH